MSIALALSPIRALTYINDFAPDLVRVIALGCEASFFVRLETSPRPGYPRHGVTLHDCHGFTKAQLDSLRQEVAAKYPGMTDRSLPDLTDEAYAFACDEGRGMAADPGVATFVRYHPDRERLEVLYAPSDRQFVDLGVFEELAHASAADLGEVELSPVGLGILFPRLGVGLSSLMLWRERYEHPTPD